MTYANGDIYEGEFKGGKKDWIGILSFANGDVCKRQFKDDEMNGICVYQLKNGSIVKGAVIPASMGLMRLTSCPHQGVLRKMTVTK